MWGEGMGRKVQDWKEGVGRGCGVECMWRVQSGEWECAGGGCRSRFLNNE